MICEAGQGSRTAGGEAAVEADHLQLHVEVVERAELAGEPRLVVGVLPGFADRVAPRGGCCVLPGFRGWVRPRGGARARPPMPPRPRHRRDRAGSPTARTARAS